MKNESVIDNSAGELLILFGRLNQVSRDIFGKKDEIKIIHKIIGRRVIDRFNIQLIHLLISDDSKFAEGFWKAFVNFHVNSTQLNSMFTLDVIANLLKLVDNNHKKLKSDESKSLLESTIFFFAVNGLLKKADKPHASYIQDEVTVAMHESYGELGIQKIPDRFFTQIIERYKNTLKNAVLLYNGILFKAPDFFNYITENNPPPTEKTLGMLKKHKLIELVSKQPANILSPSDLDDEGYIFENCYYSVISELRELIDLLRSFYSKQTSKNDFMDFSYADDFETYLAGYGERSFESVLQGPHCHLIRSLDFLLQSLKELYYFHGSKNKDTKPPVPLKSLAILAGLGNEKTIRNDSYKKDTVLVHASEDSVTYESAEKWLKERGDKGGFKRKYSFYDLIWSKYTAEELSLDVIKRGLID